MNRLLQLTLRARSTSNSAVPKPTVGFGISVFASPFPYVLQVAWWGAGRQTGRLPRENIFLTSILYGEKKKSTHSHTTNQHCAQTRFSTSPRAASKYAAPK